MTLADLVYIELAVPIADPEAETLSSHVARAKRLLRESDERRQAWLESVRREARHG